MRPAAFLIAFGLALGLFSVPKLAAQVAPDTAESARTPPGAATGARHTGSAACADCHAAEAEAWAGSHHALAWTPPTAAHVLGDFADAEFEGGGLSARFRTGPDGRFRIEVTEADGSRRAYPVRGVAGVAPLQQYLLETAPGRLQAFDVAWDTERGRWFHLYPDQAPPPGDGLHWTGPYKTWNARCAECHATGYDKGFDPRTGAYASTQVETGVGCEACHGPGGAHADWARAGADPATRPAGSGFAVDFGGLDAARAAGGPASQGALQQCAGCHSRREAFLTGSPPAGADYHDAYTLSLLRPGLYHADGQILDEVYVWGSFLQSKMQARGGGCVACHEPHAAARGLDRNPVSARGHTTAG
ncbi:MAG: multiheme c-type cytochrome, partial [Pseudomonadota bacterium]|nr:multiheme c-type cytochrome [Pseudomonadota bacterium]